MWLYIPREYCLSSQESVDLIAQYGLFFQNAELFVTLSGKPTPRPYSWRGWKTRPWMKLLYGVTLQPSTVSASMDAWTQSLAASHARTCQSQEDRKALKKETDRDSSLNTAELFAKLGPDGFSSKTSQDSFLTEQCQPYLKNFPKWGSMRSGELFQQEMWVAPILEKESSSWPTPRKSEPEGGVVENTKFENGSFSRVNQQGVRFGVKLKDAVSVWPTPRNQDSYERSNWKTIVDANTGGKTQMTLTRKVKYEANQNNAWPTPRMNDFKGHCTEATTRKDGKCRNDQLQNAVIHTGPLAQAKQKNGNESSKNDPTSPQPLKKRLNPNFVEWLMGVPVGWSLPTPIDQNAYKRWETESYRLLEQLH